MFAAYKRYFDFSGRSGRAEYWLFFLWSIILYLVAYTLDSLMSGGVSSSANVEGFGLLYGLAIAANLIPSLSVAFRRLHDTNRSAWWLLIAFIPIVGSITLIVFYVLPGTPGANRFGPGASPDKVGATFD